MNKRIKNYAIIWAIMFVVFNVICFVTPNTVTINGIVYEKINSTFWVAYVFMTLAFIGQLFCANIVFKAENSEKLFYNIPILRISYTGLILTLIFGSLCMAIPNLPDWIGVIVCILVLAFTATAVVKASAAADESQTVGKKVKAKTLFIKALTADAESLIARANSDEAKAVCKKVYETVRYSDPMSNDALLSSESAITLKFAELSKAVEENSEDISKLANELIVLVEDRNRKCKLLK